MNYHFNENLTIIGITTELGDFRSIRKKLLKFWKYAKMSFFAIKGQ